MRRDGGRSQQVAAPRQIIGIAVPVQHRCSRKLGQRAAEACGRKINLPPAYFLGSTWVHLGIKGTGHELCAKAYAQKGPTRCKPACHKGFLVSKKRIQVILIHANGAAQYNRKVCVLPQFWLHGNHTGLHIADGKPRFFKGLHKHTQIFKSHMLNGNATLHTVSRYIHARQRPPQKSKSPQLAGPEFWRHSERRGETVCAQQAKINIFHPAR